MMRMDRYDENTYNQDDIKEKKLSRTEKNKEIYNNAYDSASFVDLNNFLDSEYTEINEEVKREDVDEKEIISEEKNYNIDEYLKKAHERKSPDNNIRSLDDNDFKDQENEIMQLIASIDENNEKGDFFSDLMGDDENTMIEGQLSKEEFTKTTFEEFYTSTFLDDSKKMKELSNTTLDKALSDETITKLKLEEEETNNAFQDIFKTSGITRKKQRRIAIIFFVVTLILLIAVILFIILKG